ncbi:hypothetical protein [Flagellimonas crocea]|uniref:hypothetical protein n=1 Tax=Flagellimonas crocea TaxID=3067311 RepID=UPI00296FA51C|nr:hypothetical protein [Muricauda sp. DH64]
MTPKQAERIQAKITQVKKELAADKRCWGGFYDDSRGLRYLPPTLYIKLGDYSGANRYFNWFAKNFPDDIGYPIFLFEWTITLFKTKKKSLAEQKALDTFRGNTYLFDVFLQRPPHGRSIREWSNWASKELKADMPYSKSDKELADFAKWLEAFMDSEKFQQFAEDFLASRQL